MNAHASVPAGVLALVGDAVRRQRQVEGRCLDLLVAAGFEQVLLPVLEYASGEAPAGYRFVDPDGRLVALRTDFTPLAARVLAPCLEGLEAPFAVCYSGEVVRPQPARLRQLPELYQLGFERYGAPGGGPPALAITLELCRAVGIDLAGCRLAVGLAGLAEKILTGLIDTPAGAELSELVQMRDLDGLVERAGLHGARAEALEAALLGEAPAAWAEQLGVAAELERLAPLLDVAIAAGLPVEIDLAPRLAGGYYRGAVFSLWGSHTRAAVAAGGEYEVVAGGRAVPAAGACLGLGVAIQEASGGTREERAAADRTAEAGRAPSVGPRPKLTLALPKGRLLAPLAALLDAQGVPLGAALADAGRALVLEVGDLRVLLLKDADVPVYVAEGVAECGVAGLDQTLERRADVMRLLRLPFGRCRLCLIAAAGAASPEDGRPLLIASKYPQLAAALAERRGRRAEVIPLAGSVELAARLGLADAVVDLVESGRTLRENGLVPVEEWLEVAPYLIVNRAAFHLRGDEIRALRRTLGGRS